MLEFLLIWIAVSVLASAFLALAMRQPEPPARPHEIDLRD